MQWERPAAIYAKKALTANGWQRDVEIRIEGARIASIVSNVAAPPYARIFDLLLPGMANVHAHAFQWAMGGLTEIASGAAQDNFWSWREVMYRFNQQLTPEQIETIARGFYIALLKQGYTSVGEFHYLHHDAEGKPYANPAELSDRIVAAADSSGIHLTHLPVFYESGNFGGAPATSGQRRFLHTLDAYVALLADLKKRYGQAPNVTLGVAPHSLRAVTAENLQLLLAALPELGLDQCPIHLHIAEQEKEVADSLAWSGKRPAEWLLAHVALDARWCLIHATHTNEAELRAIAASGAVIGLCPTTEANLGDGIFAADPFMNASGRFGIGSDSNVATSPWEELRLMEYVQRLTQRKRNVMAPAGASVGESLYTATATGGAQALGLESGAIALGKRADLIALATDDPRLSAKPDARLLDTLIFATTPCVTDVFVAGQHVVRAGLHRDEEASNRALAALPLLAS